MEANKCQKVRWPAPGRGKHKGVCVRADAAALWIACLAGQPCVGVTFNSPDQNVAWPDDTCVSVLFVSALVLSGAPQAAAGATTLDVARELKVSDAARGVAFGRAAKVAGRAGGLTGMVGLGRRRAAAAALPQCTGSHPLAAP